MKLLYIANEISDDTKGVFERIRSAYPSITFISDDNGTNYDEFVSSNDDNEQYFVIIYCKHENPSTDSFSDICALGAAGMVHHAKYVLFYRPEITPFERFLGYVDEYINK